jgi:hypothetical protein
MKDILLDETGDLLFENGEAVFDESAQQDMVLIMLSEKGDFKSDALCGLGLRKLSKGQGTPERLVSDIQDQAEYCEVAVSKVELDNIIKVFV